MRRVLVLVSSIMAAMSYTLFDIKDALSSENVDVRVIRRSPREATLRRMARFYDIRLRLNGKEVTTRLKRHEQTLSLVPDNADWAGYTSEDKRGIFIIRRANETDMKLEGYISYAGARYYIQPNGTVAGHVIHKMPGSFGAHPFSGYTKASPKINARRWRRTPEMLTQPMLYLKCSFYFDKDSVDLFEKRLTMSTESIGVDDFLTQVAVFSAVYKSLCTKTKTFDWYCVEETFASLRDGVHLSLLVKPIQVRNKRYDPVERLEHRVSKDGQRRTVCAEQLFDHIKKIRTRWRTEDHAIYFTGFDLLADGGDDKMTFLGKQGSLCTQNSYSLIEISRNIRIIRTVAQLIMTSIGVGYDGGPHALSIDCPASDNYIMSPNDVAPSSELNADLYSVCTKNWLRQCISNITTPDDLPCLKRLPHMRIQTKKRPSKRFTYDAQCLVATNSKASPNQNAIYICRNGIQCDNGARIIPMPGTRCKGPFFNKRYWCDRRMCIERP